MIRRATVLCSGLRKTAGRRLLSSSGVVGFLGLGNMGLPMAINLSKTKNVLAFDLNDQAMSKAQEEGVATADSIVSVAQASSTIIIMLPGDGAVHSVLTTIAEHCPDNTTVIDCSTVSPTTSRYWQDQLASKGHAFVDAPVSGGVKGAQSASLTFMVGSAGPIEETVTPLLKTMGQRIIECGGPGAGAATKLCNNLALAAQMVGICEAMNLGEALGVDPVVLANVMNTSTAKSWSCEVNNPHPAVASQSGSPASKDYQGGFGTKLMLKDLGLAVAAAKEVHVALPLGNATKELYQLADLRGMGDKDFGVILQFLRGN
jgi:3-hydroxyisobutyrate dehydrogenase